MKDFIKKIDSICKEMDASFHLNDGGCAYVAYVISKNLERYQIPFFVRKYVESELYWGTIYHLSIVVGENEINGTNLDYDAHTEDVFMNSRQIKDFINEHIKAVNPVYKQYHNRTVSKTINDLFKNHFSL